MKLKPLIVVLAAAGIVVAGCSSSGTDEVAVTEVVETQSAAGAAIEVEVEEVEVAADPVPAPTVISLTVSFAEDKNDIKIEPVDVGEHIVDDVNRERSVLDRSNWTIVTQCTVMDKDKLTVGVIKNDEFKAISAAGQGTSIADNSLSFMLDCPA